MTGFVIFIVLLIFLVILILRNVKVVPKSKKLVVYRLGKIRSVYDSGIAMLVPLIDMGKFVEIGPKIIDVKSENVSILDSSPIGVTYSVHYCVVDPAKALQNVENYESALIQLSETHLKNSCSQATLTDVLAERSKLEERIRESVQMSCRDWGIDINEFKISYVDVPEEIQQELRRKAESERLRRIMNEKIKSEICNQMPQLFLHRRIIQFE